jgi:hypothetical protein
MKTKPIIFLMLFYSAHFSPAWCIPGINTDGSINKKEIKNFYFDGNFEKVVNALEDFRKRRQNPSEEDKIFVFKYLGVIYASNKNTQEKGESYMFQLLKLAPNIDLIGDMYISDKIDAIFQKVKKQFERMEGQKSSVRQDPAGTVLEPSLLDPAGPPALAPAQTSPDKEINTESRKKKGKKWIWFATGGIVLAGAVATFVLLSRDKPDPRNVGK